MASEWAMKEARRHWERISTGLPFISLAEALDAVRAQGRREGLEEAARIAEESGKELPLSAPAADGLYWARHREFTDVAAEIRAAINQEPKR